MIDLDALSDQINALAIGGVWAQVRFADVPDFRYLVVYGGLSYPRMSVRPSGDIHMEAGIPCWPVVDIIRRHLTEATK